MGELCEHGYFSYLGPEFAEPIVRYRSFLPRIRHRWRCEFCRLVTTEPKAERKYAQEYNRLLWDLPLTMEQP